MKFALLSLFALASVVIAHNGEDHGKNSTEKAGHGHGHGGNSTDEKIVAGDYVVLVDNDDSRSVEQIIQELGAGDDPIHHIYHNSYFKGFAGTMTQHCVDKMPTFQGIKMFEKTVEVRALATKVQNDATWGLSRISREDAVGADQDPLALTFGYTFDDDPAGGGVNIYVVDTGVNVNHVDFNGRATFGFSFDDQTFIDDNGHGTHCAGTAASGTLGVAKNANIIAVKVLDGSGSGNNANILAGINWVVQDHEQKKNQPGFRGSVISMSLGSPARSSALDDALLTVSREAGIHISVAAGNEGQDACNSSPASASSDDSGSIISVGAIDIGDRRAQFSNVGSCVTTYAPGVSVLSTFIDPQDPVNGANNIINNLDGTSMACPHVTGLIAYYLGANPDLALDPKGIKKLIVDNSVRSQALGPAVVKSRDRSGRVMREEEVAGDPQIIATNRGVQLRRRNVIRGMRPWRLM